MAGVVQQATRLYVNNIPWTCTSRELCNYFSKFGSIQRGAVFFDKNTGFSKSYGYIVVLNRETLRNIETTPKHSLEGQTLIISAKEDSLKQFNNNIEN